MRTRKNDKQPYFSTTPQSWMRMGWTGSPFTINSFGIRSIASIPLITCPKTTLRPSRLSFICCLFLYRDEGDDWVWLQRESYYDLNLHSSSLIHLLYHVYSNINAHEEELILQDEIFIIKILLVEWWIAASIAFYSMIFIQYNSYTSFYWTWAHTCVFTYIKYITRFITEAVCALYEIHKVLACLGNDIILWRFLFMVKKYHEFNHNSGRSLSFFTNIQINLCSRTYTNSWVIRGSLKAQFNSIPFGFFHSSDSFGFFCFNRSFDM